MKRPMQRVLELFSVFICLTSISCSPNQKASQASAEFLDLRGKTMGTTYHIQYRDEKNRDLSTQIDSILHILDKEQLSTYSKESSISQVNNHENERIDLNVQEDFHFVQNLLKSAMVHEWSRGNFDPTVLPLVNYWGFGTEKRNSNEKDSIEVMELQKKVGFYKLKIDKKPDSISITRPAGVKLDFSAIAKGYSAREIGIYLKYLGINDIYVEIGGELFLSGKSPKNENWRIGVNIPSVDANQNDIYQVLSVTDNCVASSGNYRNYYIQNGRILSHTINPKTGFPERNSLLSATVIGPDGAVTDAMATAAMVMGWRPFLQLIEKKKDYECYLIYSTPDGKMLNISSAGASKYLLPSN